METETTDTRLMITRTIDASIDRVWAAFADRERLATWFSPGTRTCRIDDWTFQEGGAFALAYEPTEDDGFGGPSPAKGTFLRIVPQEEIVMAWKWDFPDPDHNEPQSRLVFRFEQAAEGTRVTLIHEDLPNKESVGAHYGGWSTVLPKLEDMLA